MMNIILTFCAKPTSLTSAGGSDAENCATEVDTPAGQMLSVRGTKMVMLGQIILALRDTSNFLAIQSYSLAMSNKIAVCVFVVYYYIFPLIL